MCEVTKLLLKCDKAGIYGSLTAAVVLDTGPTGSTIGELAERLKIGNDSIKYHMQRASARGWLAPTNETRQHGARVYRLTPRGRNLKEQLC